MKQFKLYNQYHLGDNIFNINYLNKYHDYDYEFIYYIQDIYINEVIKHVTNKNIYIESISKYNGAGYNSWIGVNNFFQNNIVNFSYNYDVFYMHFFKYFSHMLGIENVINSIYDTLYLSNFNMNILNTTQHNNYDYLIINSHPNSGQFQYKNDDFENLCLYLIEKGYKIITTKKINNIECTLDYNFNLLDIGAISNVSNNIIAINTSPIITTFNTDNINVVNNRYVLDNNITYSYNNRIFSIKDIKNLYLHI
jgi:hypothetical protein